MVVPFMVLSSAFQPMSKVIERKVTLNGELRTFKHLPLISRVFNVFFCLYWVSAHNVLDTIAISIISYRKGIKL